MAFTEVRTQVLGTKNTGPRSLSFSEAPFLSRVVAWRLNGRRVDIQKKCQKGPPVLLLSIEVRIFLQYHVTSVILIDHFFENRIYAPVRIPVAYPNLAELTFLTRNRPSGIHLERKMKKRTCLAKVILYIHFFTNHIIPAENPSPIINAAPGRTAARVSSMNMSTLESSSKCIATSNVKRNQIMRWLRLIWED